MAKKLFTSQVWTIGAGITIIKLQNHIKNAECPGIFLQGELLVITYYCVNRFTKPNFSSLFFQVTIE